MAIRREQAEMTAECSRLRGIIRSEPHGESNGLVQDRRQPPVDRSSVTVAPRSRTRWRRAGALLAILVVAAVALSLDAIHEPLLRLLNAAGPVIAAHPRLGAVVFVAASAVSAMLAFFSSAVLVPVALVVWDRWTTIALLWLGWLLGGVFAYGIGRALGRPLVNTVGSARLIAFYQRRVSAGMRFPTVLLLQFALPSEIPGYLLGILRVRFRVYLAALALVELPYAIGTVLLGESIVQQRAGWLLVLGAAGVGVTVLAAYLLHRRLGRAARTAEPPISPPRPDPDA